MTTGAGSVLFSSRKEVRGMSKPEQMMAVDRLVTYFAAGSLSYQSSDMICVRAGWLIPDPLAVQFICDF